MRIQRIGKKIGNGRDAWWPARAARQSRVIASAGVVATFAAQLAILGLTAPAHAAPPVNDDIASATPISTIPATFTQDTTEATATREDGRCVGGRSIWYRYRPATSTTVRLTTFGSDYDTLLAVFAGTRNNRELIKCADDDLGLNEAVRLRAEAGTRYWIVVSSCCRRSSPLGGVAQLNVFRGAPPPGGEIAITTAESGGVSGRLIVSGTAHCDTQSVFAVWVIASQRVGANVASGDGGSFEQPCWPGQENTWRVRIDSFTGWAFQPGSPVMVNAEWWISDGFRSVGGTLEASPTVTDDPAARHSGSRR